MESKAVAHVLEEIGTFMELKGENPFKVKAFTGAGRTIETLDGELVELVASGAIAGIKGIGPATREVIVELVTTGHSSVHAALKAEIPPGLLEMLEIPGLGPKKIKAIHEGLGIASVGELEYACHENRLATLAGFGTKSQEKILKGIAQLKAFRGRHLYVDALPAALTILGMLEGLPDVKRVAIAGSMRRRMETVKDLDLVAASAHAERVMAAFTTLPESEVLAHGPTKSTIRLASGLQVDLRVVTDAEFPFALHHFTGSKDHNEALRSRAKHMGLLINEYGLFRGETLIPCADETAFYHALGLDFIPPELREGLDEIALAERHALPELVRESEIQGVFHVHTTYSDGGATLERMTQEAKRLGYRYLGISDHSQAAAYAHGLTPERIREQHAEIDALNARLGDIRLLKGIEADILADGSIDYDEDTLSSFDFVIASVHSRFGLGEEAMTERIVRAIRHPRVTMLGHMTGRLLLARDPYALDLERVFHEAAEHGVIIELNANPHRLDIDWRHLRRALELGVMIAINPDAHSIDGLQDVRFGVGIARKGGASAAQVFNTRSLDEVLAHLAGRHAAAAR
jgi:DNA polymerase (family 10)